MASSATTKTATSMSEPDTTEPRLAPAPAAPTPGFYRGRSRTRRFLMQLAFFLGLGVGLAVVMSSVPAQWVAPVVPGESLVDDGAILLRPGSARPTSDSVEIADVEVFESDGEIFFTTVAVDESVSVADWLSAWMNDAIELRSRADLFGERSSEEQRERNLQLMENSKDVAVVAALEYLGVDAIEETGIGFNQVLDDSPAAGALVVGDVIVAFDNTVITGIESLLDALARFEPGDEAVVSVENIDTGEFRDETLTLGTHPDGDGAFIGIADLRVRGNEVDLPFELDIDSGSVGGPSAGLAFTLTMIDLLTPGELTGENDVAVTGTISGSGLVGNVGGVAQKAAAVEASGADLFIVPLASVEEAESTTTNLTIVGVETLQEAIDALADLGGDTSELALVVPGLDAN